MTRPITIQATVNAPMETIWECWNDPKHISGWAFASDDWEAPSAKNDLRVGGTFTTRMQAKDGSAAFDFSGTYTRIIPGHAGDIQGHERKAQELRIIEYTMGDGRKVSVQFTSKDNATEIKETFDPENENPIDMQRDGWQAILDNFKKYVEAYQP